MALNFSHHLLSAEITDMCHPPFLVYVVLGPVWKGGSVGKVENHRSKHHQFLWHCFDVYVLSRDGFDPSENPFCVGCSSACLKSQHLGDRHRRIALSSKPAWASE